MGRRRLVPAGVAPAGRAPVRLTAAGPAPAALPLAVMALAACTASGTHSPDGPTSSGSASSPSATPSDDVPTDPGTEATAGSDEAGEPGVVLQYTPADESLRCEQASEEAPPSCAATVLDGPAERELVLGVVPVEGGPFRFGVTVGPRDAG